MVVVVFGLGFVGLTTALGFAHIGHKVYGIESQADRAKLIENGELPFLEPGMGEVLKEELNRNFFVNIDIETAIKECEVVYYCVGTPYGSDGAADLAHLFSAIDNTLTAVNDGKFRALVIKSTVPPTTTSERVVSYVEAKGFSDGVDIGIANNPEFLREGYCWDDFINADRIVLGINDSRTKLMLEELYHPMNIPVFTVNRNTGEFIKYLSNTLLATLISYSNEMSLAADAFGDIDISAAFKILHLDKRWGGCSMTSYVYPGCGYGGYCLPKDTNAFYAQSKEKGYIPKILESVIKLNDSMPDNAAGRIAKVADRSEKIGFLGLSFKPNSDDVRDTPAAKIIDSLIQVGYHNIIAYDPVANDEFSKHYEFEVCIEYKNSLSEIVDCSDVLVIVTAWEEFRRLKDWELSKRVVDLRYMF